MQGDYSGVISRSKMSGGTCRGENFMGGQLSGWAVVQGEMSEYHKS